VRASGESYFTHPLAVARILAGLKINTATVVTGLLHDTVEDTLATSEEITNLFGKDVAFWFMALQSFLISSNP